MIKGKYLIVGHMWWCSLVVGKGTREVDVAGLNPSNGRKNRATWGASAVGKRKHFLIFIHTENIYFNIQKNDVRHLCVDIGDMLRLMLVTFVVHRCVTFE